MARLVLMQAGGGEKSFLLGATAVIGRDPQNEVPLDDQAASRQHCRVEKRSNGYVLIDLGSRNGTFVNGERVGTEQALNEGDRIKVGGSELEFTDQVRYSLEFVAGEHLGDKIPLTGERVTFGRKPTNTVALSEIGVSGVHCEVVTEGGRPILRDMGSTNGTFLEGQKIDEVVLSHGDRIRVGTTELVFSDATAGPVAARAGAKNAATSATESEADAPMVLTAAPRRNRVVAMLVPLVLLLAVGGAAYFYFTRARSGALRTSVPPQAGNLITQEWSFEDPELLTQYFELAGDGLRPFRHATPGGRSGLASLSVTLDQGSRALVSPRHALDVEPEHRYLIRVQAKGGSGGTVTPSVTLGARLPNAGGQEVEWPLASRALGNDYVPIEATVVVPPNVRQLRPVIGAYGSGTVAIDDLEMFDQGAVGELPQIEGFELLASGAIFSLLQFKNLQFAGGFVEVKHNGQVISPCTVAAAGSLKPEAGGKSLSGEWSVDNAPEGAELACGFVVAEGLGGGRVRVLSERGAEPREGPFDAAPCQSLLLGSGGDLIQLRFAEPQNVSGKPIEGGAFALSVHVQGKLAFHVDLSFQDQRLRAQTLLSEADQLVKQGKFGEALARAQKVTDELPYHESELDKARSLSATIATEARKRQELVETLVSDALFLENPQKFGEAEKAAREAMEAFAGSPSAETFKALLGRASTEKTRFDAARRSLEAERLLQMATTLCSRPERKTTGQLIARYIVTQLGETPSAAKAKQLTPGP